ncbi:MAG: family 10 glycosylhydrolase [Bacteroidales bacterium]|nr:family 10 glycosylhydrolase [Bacteroidales bacterium]
MKIFRNILIAFSLIAFAACDETVENPWNPDWNVPDEPSVPDTPEDPGQEPEPEPDKKDAKARLVWIDAAANFGDYANDADKIASDMARIKETGFTGVIVEVRPTTGGVLFKSDVEGPVTRVDAWVPGAYVWLERTAGFDYLQAFIDAGKEVGLDVFAAINTMIAGKQCPYGLGNNGPIFDGSIKKDWASVVNTAEGLVNCMDMGDGTKFLNPANDEVVEYLLGILEDLAAYDVAGIILDRCRYDDYELQSDFSEVSRAKFEDYIGEKIQNWPSDVFAPGADKLSSPVTQKQIQWMEFRAKNIHDFMEKASERVHSVNPDVRFGAYVGAWYSSYYYSGVNWASPNYNAKNSYNWATPEYSKYGYADHCDIMIIGAYASTKSIYGSGEWTMQGFCKKAQPIFADDVPFIGGPDIGNSSGFENGGQGKLMPDIVDACINASTEGMFFFDLCHIKMYDYWDDIKKAFDQYLESL